MVATNYDCYTRSQHVELNGAYVRLVSLHDETLRERAYRGVLANTNAVRQAQEWSRRFEVPIIDPRSERIKRY